MTMTNLPSHIYPKQAPNSAGSGLFTSQAIDAGKEIFRIDRPLVSVLDSPHLKDACSNCYVWVPENGVGQFGEEKDKEVKLRACQGCKIDRYCSKVGLISTCWLLPKFSYHIFYEKFYAISILIALHVS